MIKNAFRILLLPLGLIKNLISLSIRGSRDIYNKYRFNNSIIDKSCSIDSNTFIGSNVHILEKCIINNSKISSYSYIGRNCIVQNTSINKFCSIANDVIIGLGNHPKGYFSTSPLFYWINNAFNIKLIDEDLIFDEYKKIAIGNDVWIGARAIIMDGVIIGDGAIVAANSVVTKNVAPYSIVGV